jgi:hypothetical protein
MNKEKLEELRKVSKEYIKEEKRVLQAQYDFLTNIQNKRGLGSVNKSVSDAIAERAKTNLQAYIEVNN